MKRQNRIAFFNILSTLILRGVSIFTAPLISRLLGDSDYGVVSIYTIWVGAVAIAFTLQTQGTIVNARIEYPENEQHKYQSSVMSLSLLVFLCCSALVLLFIRPVSELLRLHWVLVIMVLIQSFGNFCIGFLNNKFTYEFKAGKNFILSIGVALSTLALSVVLILLMPEEHKYMGRILSMVLINSGLGGVICVYILTKGKTFYNRDYWKFCIALSVPVMFHNLSDLILGQSDRLMLQHMLGEAGVGQYSLSLNFGNIMFTIFGALNNSWVPFFFDDMKQGRRDSLKKQSENFLELFTVLSVGFILLATEVYHIFASREFWPGTMLIPIFVTGYYLNFLCTFPVNYEYYHKKTKIVAAVTIFSALLNLVLNYFLIRSFGMAGAALATTVSHSAQLLLHHCYSAFVIGRGSYPFPVGFWGKYAAVYFAILAMVYATEHLPLLRWGLGACIGLWELRRIWKRKVLI